MTFIEVKAMDYRTGETFKSKAAMKRAIAEAPQYVKLMSVSSLGGSFHGSPNELTEGTTLVVVGPDPYTDRKWYGNIKRVKGVIKVS